MKEEIRVRMNDRQVWLFEETMHRLDAQYDDACGLLTRKLGTRIMHDIRGSSHYALGLFVRDEAGDRDRACQVLAHVLDAQFLSDPSMAYYGGFPFDDRQKEPPREPFPGKHFDAESRYYLEKWQEQIRGHLLKKLEAHGYDQAARYEIEDLFRQSLLETVPVVWGNFDANWPDFIATELAMIVSVGADLGPELTARVEAAGRAAVENSIRRWQQHFIPMNTNVELMHVFICGFFGEWLDEPGFVAQARVAAADIRARYEETMSFAEYNSATYNSVDLCALAMWRLCLKDAALMETGRFLEAQLWRNICEMYHPGLNNVSGPYSRNYDNDMAVHSMIPAFLYLAYGEEKPRPLFNVETAGYIDLALNGTLIPEDVKEAMRAFQGPRKVRKTFRELMERGRPGDDTSLCTVTAQFEENWMIGAMSGSRNTSGQLRSLVAFWKSPSGSVDSLSLLRRMPGRQPGEHLWTVYFDGTVDGNAATMRVRPAVDRDIEVYFDVIGADLEPAMVQESLWSFPGMTFQIETNAGKPEIRKTSAGLEIVYFVSEGSPDLEFELRMQED